MLHKIIQSHARHPRRHLWMILPLLALSLLAACGTTTAPDRYGGNTNHIHDLLAPAKLPGVVLVATHYGLYRSADNGDHWALVAGGSGQAMDGLMIFRLAQDPQNPQHLFVLAIPRNDRPQDARSPAGLYASTDGGQSWTLAADVKNLPDQTVYTLGIGPGRLFLILPALAEKGLLVSSDNGQSWKTLPTTPDPHPTGITGDPAHPDRLWLWGTATGLYRSDDVGNHWAPANGVQGGIFAVSVAGSVITVSGDSGVFRSTDGGDHFAASAAVNDTTLFTSIVVAPAQTDQIYAITGTTVEHSKDGGKTFAATSATRQHVGNVAVDPTNPQTVYAASSYPIGIERSTNSGQSWATVLAGP